MAETVEFELVSPERLVVSRPATMVIMPGSQGYFGAQPGHAPLIATLGPGVVDLYEGDQITDRIFVAGGVAEVTETRCTVLAEEATPVAQIDRAEAEQQVRDLSEDVDDSKSDSERQAIQARLAIARAKLEAVTGQPVV
ncbi:MAG TPA: ATP synthase F1 subunit epsilon [Azospirillaceae bacterium]|nr:ATP synthase F1 subunit epsilon [Azospirillaceae bacterium]